MTIYLDCNATTPIDPEVAKVVRHYMEVEFGNAGSRTHEYGLRAKQAVERAREQVAAVVDAKPDEVIFTSGATEANNLAILGLEAEGRRTGKMHIVSTQIEHKAVLEPLEEMRRRGFEVDLVSPDGSGRVPPGDLLGRVRPDTLLVSVMHANNETGVLQDVGVICRELAGSPVLIHCDCAQTVGKVGPLDVPLADMISVSAHKMHGPKGVGCLIVRRQDWSRAPIRPLLYGGGQERGLRAGTVPVALVAGFGEAAAQLVGEAPQRARTCRVLRRLFLDSLGVGFEENGDSQGTMPHVANICLPGVDAEALIVSLRGRVAVSTGSACNSTKHSPSHVLLAMGMNEDRIRSSIRVSWSAHHTPQEMAQAGREIRACWMRLSGECEGVTAKS